MPFFQEINADVYSSLLKALTMPDNEHTSCYPVRISAAGAIAELLEVGPNKTPDCAIAFSMRSWFLTSL
jgi:hypothetical protein